MVWFEYEYNTTKQILDSVRTVSEFSVIELSTFIAIIIGVIGSILYIFPFFIWFVHQKKKEKSKKKRKKLLSQISMQKEIEDEIAAEIETTNQ